MTKLAQVINETCIAAMIIGIVCGFVIGMCVSVPINNKPAEAV